jgi:hypothetical protein
MKASKTKPDTTPKPRTRTIRKPATTAVVVTTEEIALEAYTLFQERGGSNGDALSDWLEAERRVLARRSTPAPVRSRARRAAPRSA